MKIGVQLYTVRDYLKNEAEIEASLKRIKAIGYDIVQISGLGPCNFDKLVNLFKETGLEVCGTHSSWEQVADPAELKKLIEEHKRLNATQIGIGIKPNNYPDTYDGYTQFIKKVNEICKQVQDAGLTFGYHNHEHEFMKFNGICAIDRMIDECPDLEFVLDVFWVQAGGANPLLYIDKLKERIKIAHLKDFRVDGRHRQFAEIGQGNLDWASIFSRLKQYGTQYAVVEQDGDFLVDPFESLAMSRKYLVENGYWK
ncbi:MAG: sugar phosphate isomerase/epimerase [Treponema sp.]|jgi:sugar phosphate isomerase/epimerase|nr:sugar phosphate isomerase/epimerase [Treponema sp.]